MSKKNALDGLLGKLDTQLNAEKSNRKPDPIVAIGGGIGAVPNPVMNVPQKVDPLNFKRSDKNKIRQGKALKRQAMLRQQIVARHNQEPDDDIQDQDLKENLDFVDENKDKTMDWTEPDGSKTTLKFDQDGTLIGKVRQQYRKR